MACITSRQSKSSVLLRLVCRYCLADTSRVSFISDVEQIYEKMVKETFNIHIHNSKDLDNMLCLKCSENLRSAAKTKRKILEVQKILLEQSEKFDNIDHDTAKQEMECDYHTDDLLGDAIVEGNEQFEIDSIDIKTENLNTDENNEYIDSEIVSDDNQSIRRLGDLNIISARSKSKRKLAKNGSPKRISNKITQQNETTVRKRKTIENKADEEREENEGGFEKEYLFQNEEYPVLDPESDPFSDISSDFYHPSLKEDEESNSDGSICDKRRQTVTNLMPLNTKQHDLHQVQNINELSSHQQQVDAMPLTIEGHQSQAEECNDSVEKARNRDFCFYCESHVLNFARHLIRHHYLEVDVQKILVLPKKSRTRRNLITDLKKKGNYISNVVRPVRREKRLDRSDYLPCSNCLGFYARKQLWKHKKKCDPEHKGSQAEAQNFMCRNSLHIPSKSLQKVFSRMRADKISFVAKQDPIICQFGENYIKIHREEHFIPITSRKMRELAKLLIEVQKIKPEMKTYFDTLKPQNYDTLVAATRIVAKYNESTDRYCSPTYAMNISTSIKQCCNIAIMKILKTETSIKTAEMQADLKTLVQLIESKWKFDVSSNAADDLNLKKWNKVTIVPLASDLKLRKDHLCAVAQNSAAQLREDENNQADISNITSRSTKKKRVLVPWTSPQKNIVTDHFRRHIRSKKPPKRHECDELKALHPELLKNKDWLKIKVFIQNCYTKH